MAEASLIIREPIQEDVAGLRPIFEHWIKDPATGLTIPNEVAAIEDSINTSISGENIQRFLVAEKAGKILGVMGIQPPELSMFGFTETQEPLELITALVSHEARGEGVGKALVAGLTQKAIERGASELVVNSGPRYKLSGWPFWQSQFGEPAGIAYNKYGAGNHAMVWRKELPTK